MRTTAMAAVVEREPRGRRRRGAHGGRVGSRATRGEEEDGDDATEGKQAGGEVPARCGAPGGDDGRRRRG